MFRSPLKEDSEPALRMLRESQHQLIMITGALDSVGVSHHLRALLVLVLVLVLLVVAVSAGGLLLRQVGARSQAVCCMHVKVHSAYALMSSCIRSMQAPAGDAPLTACHAAAQVHIVTRPALILSKSVC